MSVDWSSTFTILNDVSDKGTSMLSHHRKARKIKLMLEELPTIEHLKYSFLEVYDGWKCPCCGLDDETFDHVWTCTAHLGMLIRIRNQSKHLLFDLIAEKIENIDDIKSSFETLDMWNILYDSNHFTFIDLIKGIIPSSFSVSLSRLKKSDKLEILQKFFDSLYDSINKDIWYPRCAWMEEFETSLGLDLKEKLKSKNNVPYFNVHRKIGTDARVTNLEGIRRHIYFGENMFDYYNNRIS